MEFGKVIEESGDREVIVGHDHDHDVRIDGSSKVICTHSDMLRTKDQIDAHILRYIDNLNTSHINVTIAGGGNAVHVLAAYCGHLPNVKTTILKCNKTCARFRDALAVHDNQVIARHQDGRPDIVGTVNLVTDLPEETIPTADVVIISLPAFAHEEYFTSISPYLTPGTIVGVMVAEGGTDWLANSCFGDKKDEIVFFGLETLPWACRYEEYGHLVNVRDTKQIVNVAVHPPSQRFQVCAVLQYLIGFREKSEEMRSIPEYHPVSNLLSLSLMNMNAYVHPSIIYCKFMEWDGESSFAENPLFYEDSSDTTPSVLAAISSELLALKEAITTACPEVDLSNVMSMKQWLRSVYGDPIPDNADMQTSWNIVVKLSGRYGGIRHVMHEVNVNDSGTETEKEQGEMKVEGDLKSETEKKSTKRYIPDTTHRYWTEDVPCGLVVIQGIAQLFEVEMPMMKTVILWMQEKMGKEYITADGRVAGAHVGETKAPQRFGLTKEAILQRYIH